MYISARFWRVVCLSVIAIVAAACGDEETVVAAVAVDPGNQAPVITGTPDSTVIEGELYDFLPVASDPDGDSLVFGIDSMPGWLEFDTTSGSLSGTPDEADVGTYSGIDIWVSDGIEATLLPRLEIRVLPASASQNRAPAISGSPETGIIVGNFYDFIPVASDADGDALSFSVQNLPAWASFDVAIGRISGTPAASSVGAYGNIVIQVTDGIDTSTLAPFAIVVNPPPSQNTPPTISGQPASSVAVGATYSFVPTAGDFDGDPISFSVLNAPGWVQFSQVSGTLSGTPGQSDVGNYNGITIAVSDGTATSALPTFGIEVIDPNSPPTISGNPDNSVAVDGSYSFVPSANDPDGDTLSFSITGQPSWSSFNTTNGALSGVPDAGDAGSYDNIRINVSDGDANATLGPFSIDVVASNSAPVISGTPPGSVLIGNSYSFVPQATDPDGDTLSFSIVGRPSWAGFDSANGALTGTPGAGAVGTYSNISITVSDASDDATLGSFSIVVLPIATGSATLSWLPPTENTDGSPLTDLTGYVVYWGDAPGSYQNSETLANPGLTSYIVENLLSGNTYFFATTAYNSGDVESGFSNVGSKTIL